MIQDRKVSLEVTARHVELTPTHLVIGLQIDWLNRTDKPIPVKEIRMKLYLHGPNREPLRFYPLERFERITGKMLLRKSPVRPFTLPVFELYTEQIRFLCQDVLDIPPRSYTVEIEIIDTSDTSYTDRTKMALPKKIKYRQSQEWREDIDPDD